MILTFKVPIITAADNSFLFFFLQKISIDISCESSANEMIHKKWQDIFSMKNKLEMRPKDINTPAWKT